MCVRVTAQVEKLLIPSESNFSRNEKKNFSCMHEKKVSRAWDERAERAVDKRDAAQLSRSTECI